jgi:hypothetical protein
MAVRGSRGCSTPMCMGIGHIAVGFASKRWAPNASLGWLLVAPVFVDILFSVFVLVGIERARIVPGITEAMPLDLQYIGVSHSLVTMVGWSVAFAGLYLALHRDRRAAVVLGLGVFSHFVLDWVSHGPDMPILPSGPRLGLGLWNFPVTAMLVELIMLAAGVALYLQTTRASRPRNTLQILAITGVLVVINVAAYFGPPPPAVEPMAIGNLALLGLLWLLARLDRGRELRSRAVATEHAK